MPNILIEVGAHYYFPKKDEKPEPGYQFFQYQTLRHDKYVKTTTVACHNRDDFEKLLAHWNRTHEWRYKED